MKQFIVLPLAMALGVSMTACTKAEKTAPATNETANIETTASSVMMNHDAHTNSMASSTGTQTQPPHIMAYMDIMGKMHQDMSAGVAAKNADVGFAKGMIPHHEGAIAMAKVELQYGKDAEMKALAQKVIDAQQSEIKYMQDWLAKNESSQPAASNAQEVAQAYQQKNMANHDAMMQGTMDANPDIAFAKGMIPHHQGAIDMAAVEAQYGKNTDMLKLSEQVKQAQTPEIKQMQDWLSKQAK